MDTFAIRSLRTGWGKKFLTKAALPFILVLALVSFMGALIIQDDSNDGFNCFCRLARLRVLGSSLSRRFLASIPISESRSR
jgi:hypothetical protein